MFKKVELWLVLFLLIIFLVSGLGFGVLVHQGLVGRSSAGAWSVKPIADVAVTIASVPEKLILHLIKPENLRIDDPWDEQRHFWVDGSLESGFNGYPLDFSSYLLLSRYDHEEEKSIVELVDLKTFETIHTWAPDFKELILFNGSKSISKAPRIINPLLTADGGLVFNGMGSQLVKIDKCSNPSWVVDDYLYHHSINEGAENTIAVPIHVFPYVIDAKYTGSNPENYLSDGIAIVSNNGRLLYKKSISELFIEKGMEHLLFASAGRTGEFKYDPIHLNSIKPVMESGKFWEKGDLFLSLRGLSMLILYRPSTNEIIWKDSGKTFQQHDIEILDDHRISIFNNNSRDFFVGNRVDGHNSVLIYDFESGLYSSHLGTAFMENDIRTVTEGKASILTNGDVFVEETNYGRTLYIESDGRLKWTHLNSSKDGKVFAVNWSRILFSQNDLRRVDNLINLEKCND
jgi:hypothetical protein